MLAIVLSLVAVALSLMGVFIAVQAKKKGGRAGDGAGESATDPCISTHGDTACGPDGAGGGCDGGGGD